VGDEMVVPPRKLFILSDFTASCFPVEHQHAMLEQVAGGAGLLMIGGWESYQGAAGHWHGTPVAEALPVEISGTDDRVNCDQPTFARPLAKHPILANLPWDDRPPVIGGYNRVRLRDRGTLLMAADRYAAQRADHGVTLEPLASDPLLVVGAHGSGRIACWTSDVAPHWIGPMVDWGDQRVAAQAPGAEAVEVGNHYAQYFTQLLRWTGQLD